ncbi:MAG: ABC transporter substrate-binding protein, partial [Lacisediminimonas sp.]|nr:ABC transporter substrate-binding protein [Lacisediminimonas sp.]
TDSEKLAAAFKGLPVNTPFGPIVYRAQDHQSTLGTYVGRLGIKDGKGVMVNYKYADGASYQPTDAEVKQMRPASN